MQEEYDSIMRNDVWEVVPRPKGKSVVTSKWLYKINYVADVLAQISTPQSELINLL
jgi:hypothetical protein